MNTNTNFLQGRGFQGHRLTIASVFPAALRAERNYNPEMTGGRTVFKLEGSPKGEYRLLHLSDCWELIQSDKSRIGAPVFDQAIVQVQHIASCLLNEWAVNIAGTRSGQRPGIMVIAGETPTPEELASLNAMQSAYFDGLIHEGDAFAARHDFKSISELHRNAAKWRGHEAAWVTNLGEGQEKKECHWCASRILARARFCMHCRREQPGAETVAPAEPAEAKRVPGRPLKAELATA